MMNRNRLLMIGLVALMLGAFVSLFVYKNLLAKTASAAPPGVNVVIAGNDIQVGAKIAGSDLRVVRLPSGDLPPHYFSDEVKVIGQGAILPIARGEFILPYKLAGEHAGFGLPALIPTGMRAVSVRVNDVVGVAGFVLPGTRVDVLLTGNASGSSEQQTTTVLENVAVIANGQKLDRNSGGEPQNAAVITLLVSPDDAQRLTLASTQGHIQLALRNPLDTKQENVLAVNSNSLYKGIPTPAPKIQAKVRRPVNPAPAAPSVYSVEVIRGEKKDVTNF
jgi:pilus assembly protein CpaB